MSQPARPALPRPARWTEHSLVWWLALAALLATLVMPLATVQVPPVLDYPNHLTRAYLLASGLLTPPGADPDLARFYAPHWAVIPNLATDLVLLPLVPWLGLHVAGRIMLGLSLALPVLGCAAYHRAAFRTRSYWPFTAGLIATGTVFQLGLSAFLIAAGMALIFAAGWLRLAARPTQRALLGMLATALLFFLHLAGAGFFAVLIGAAEASALSRLRRAPARMARSAAGRTLVLIAALAPALALLRLAPAEAIGGAVRWHRPAWKAFAAVAPFMAFDCALDWASAALFLALIYALLRDGALRPAAPALPALLALGVIGALAPFAIHETTFVDLRVLTLAALMLSAGLGPAGARPSGSQPNEPLPFTRLNRAATFLVVALLVLRTGETALAWERHGADLSAFRRTIAPVPAGSLVLVVRVSAQDSPEYWDAQPLARRARPMPLDLHLPALLVLERHAFWPLLFADPAKQPLVVRPPFRDLALPSGVPPDWHDLATGRVGVGESPAPYLADWPRRFDYVLVLDAGGAGRLDVAFPGRLDLVHAEDIAALYRVRRPGAAEAQLR